MAASTRARKPKSSAAPGLAAALAFVLPAQKKDGEPWQSHCRIENNWLIGFNGIFAAGMQIEEDFSACPNTGLLAAAISKCGDKIAITQASETTLSVRSGRFRATVPCLPPGHAPSVEPDAACAVVDDRLKVGFGLLAPMLEDTAPRVLQTAVLLQANTMVGSNGAMLIETFHGIDLPPGIMVPRATALAISKCPKKLAQFGFSQNSVTFYYEDGSFIKSQLFSGQYPDYRAVFSDNCNYWPLPDGFFEGIKAIEAFSKASTNAVEFTSEGMRVFAEDGRTESGAFEIEGLPPNRRFNIDFLKISMSVLHRIDLATDESALMFLSEDGNTRGVIKGLR